MSHKDTIPCDDCESAKTRFERDGFTVLGCTAHPSLPGMCEIEYELPTFRPHTVAVRRDGASLAATSIPEADDIEPTDLQRKTIEAIVNVFETGTVRGDYGAVTSVPGDPGRLTYGRSQTSLQSGGLHTLLTRYVANTGARFGPRLAPWLPAFAAQSPALDTDRKLHNLLRACADDPVMRDTQDAHFAQMFWQPALRAAQQAGLRTALGIAVVYDSIVHGSWDVIRKQTEADVGLAKAAGEARWVRSYVERRRAWLAGHKTQLLHATTYRMDAFMRLIDQDLWGLPLPLVVRGAEISEATLNALPPNCYDGPAMGSRPLAIGSNLLRGLDVRQLQLALSDLGANVKADGVYGQASAACVRAAQIARDLPATGVADVALIARLVR